MKTLRETYAGYNNIVVRLIYDVWKEEGSTARTQVRLPYMPIEEVVEKYGDFIYDGWYTEGWTEDGRWKASLWAIADKKRRIDPWMYEHWPELWKMTFNLY
jgi:hypothetical protein